MTQRKLQLWVVAAVLVFWAVSILVASFDGNVMVKAMTPAATLVLGWLFASKATNGR